MRVKANRDVGRLLWRMNWTRVEEDMAGAHAPQPTRRWLAAEPKREHRAIKREGQFAYYSDNTIFIPKGWERDAQVIYREYLHHVLYSKVGSNNIGPERSALESGVADYLVASYSGSPRVYAVAFGTAVNLETAAQLETRHRSRGQVPDRAELGGSVLAASANVGRAQIDRAVWSAWFDLGKDLPDRSIPNEMTTRLVARASGNDSASRSSIRTICSSAERRCRPRLSVPAIARFLPVLSHHGS